MPVARTQCVRRGCKDVFHPFMLRAATYDGYLEIPCLKPENSLPSKLISFSKAISSKDYECWVHFYEDDVKIERIWTNPSRYLPVLKRFRGVICPDFSVYRDMPLPMQRCNILRSRTIGHWLQDNKVLILPNVRYGDERTFDTCCLGIAKGSVIAVGSHGVMRKREDRLIFQKGLEYVAHKLEPEAVVVYGAAPDSVFGGLKRAGITFLQFASECSIAHRKAVRR
ncbi:MAG: DUF4417 domain-containing protein [bacterium]|nr:DUF4417 domain-containing protein [bacterium]